MKKLPMSVVQFSEQTGVDKLFFEQFTDYYYHYMDEFHGKKLGAYDKNVSFSAKDDKIYKGLMSNIKKVSGQDMTAFSESVMAMNPMVNWATMAIVGQAIDAILPVSVIDSIGIYTELKTIGFGDSASYDIAPRSLFTVSQAGNAQRTAFIQKQFKTTRTLTPVNHEVTVQVSLYSVLARKESLAEFTRKAVMSIETQMTRDAYNAFKAGLNAVTVPTNLSVTGYTEEDLLRICQTVQAYNQGAKPSIIGTSLAIRNILPNGADGYRIVTNSDNMSIQLIKNFFDYDIIVLPQVAKGDADYGLQLDDNELYVVSTSSDKLVKGAIEGEVLTNSNDFYDNANLTSNATMNKRWAFEFMSNAIAGIVHIA